MIEGMPDSTHDRAVQACEEAGQYTLGPALRIADIKNMGRDLAWEELRICPWLAHEPWGPERILDFLLHKHQNPRKNRAKTSKSSKRWRAARAKTHRFDHRYRDFANDAKN